MVLIVQGSSARLTPETKKLPIDAADHRHRRTVHVDRTDAVFRREANNRNTRTTAQTLTAPADN